MPPQSRRPKKFYFIWAVILFNVLYCIALVLTVLLQCAGKKETPGTTCINTYALLVGASTINVASDTAIFIIPLVAVWNLHMATRQKLGLSVVFAVGVLYVSFRGRGAGNLADEGNPQSNRLQRRASRLADRQSQ